ncbi:unnamed protein product [Thelazia callipaeda]|uniref:Mitogen-activated protein kinase kinase kinase n=1 Tax=Thelazia callipaeda TaxID=103827 RepID=A0A0N5CJ77_THECL|nr:unnamed protein product [Thelazia callipaeda]
MDVLPPLKIENNLELGDSINGSASFSSPTIADDFNNDPFLNADFYAFQLIHLLGRGSYGDVWKAKCNKITVALKIIKSNEVLRGIFYKEVEAMRFFDHPNVIAIFGACVRPVHAIAMEYMECGSLDHLLHVTKNIDYKADHAFHWASQCADAMAYIHGKHCAHADLKPANLLLQDNYHHLKVADFGTVIYTNCDMDYRQGSASWMAPEVISGSPPSKYSDYYSFGIILWEIITRKRPYDEYSNAEEILWSVYAGSRPPVIANIPARLMQMIESCWNEVPNERPSIQQIQKVLCILRLMYPNFNDPLTYAASRSINEKTAARKDKDDSAGNIPFLMRETDTGIECESSSNC